MTGLQLRGAVYYLVKRVPREFAHLETRAVVRRSLRTGDRREAEKRATRKWAAMLACWEAGRAADADDSVAEAKAVDAMRKAEGVTPRSVGDLAAGPLDELLRRVEALQQRDPQARSPALAKAWLTDGRADKPVPISNLLEFLEENRPDRLSGMSADQKRRWRNPRKKVIRDLLESIGDKPFLDVDGKDAEALRRHYWEQIEGDEIRAETGNKYMHYISALLRACAKIKHVSWQSPFESLAFDNDPKTERRRRAFSTQWIVAHIVPADGLEGLNLEATDILRVMVNTGARPSEIIGLPPEHIYLDAPIPYIAIVPEGRVLKTPWSIRDIPLVGVSLEAMRRHPEGFPRYRGKGGWSNLVNKFLRLNCEIAEDQSAYSLRHAFEDRLLAAGAVDRLAADLMGHATTRERYGDGATLEMKLEILQRIAL